MRRSSGPIAVAVIVLLFILPAPYVLSVGPAIWLHDRGLINDEPAQSIYQPLEYLSDVPGFRSALLWYVQIWQPEDQLPRR